MEDNWISRTLYSNGVLKNKLGIRDAKQLQEKEYLISATVSLRLINRHLRVKSITDLLKMHQLMFGKLYDWAGKERKGNFRKGNTEFFPYQKFGFARENIDKFIQSLPEDEPLTKRDYAEMLDKINFYHPFREGNGRSAKLFIQCFAAQHHQVIDYPRSNDVMIGALNNADIDGIAKTIRIENTPDRDAAYKGLELLKRKS